MKTVGHATYWSNRAVKAMCGTDAKTKNAEVQSLRRVVADWLHGESGYPGAGYPKPYVIRAIRDLEEHVD